MKYNKWTSIVVIYVITLICSCDSPRTKRYKQKINNDESVLHLPFTKAVYSIFEDSKNNTWIGSREEGVCRININKMDCFTTKDGLQDNQVRSIQEGANGNIWFASGKGLTHFDGEKFTIHSETEVVQALGEKQIKWGETPKDLQLLDGNGIDIYKYQMAVPGYFLDNNNLDTKGQFNPKDLWFNAGEFSGAYSFDGEELSYLPFPLLRNTPNQNTNKNFYPVSMIYKGKRNLWLASYSGFFGFDGKTMMVLNNKSFNFNNISQQFHIRGIFEDSKGNLWIGNNGLGVGVLKFDGVSMFSFTEGNGLITLNSTDEIKEVPESDGIARVFSINEDDNGNIWFGTRDKGAWRYDGKELTQFTKNDGLSNNYIRLIFKDKQGKMWFGAGDGSVHQFNGKSFLRIY